MKFYSFWRSLASFRVRIALNLKGIDAEVVQVNLLKGEQRRDEYRTVNPLMVIPSLVDGDGPILFESLAILEYLDETHPKPPLLPKDPRARARADRRLRRASTDRAARAQLSRARIKARRSDAAEMGSPLVH